MIAQDGWRDGSKPMLARRALTTMMAMLCLYQHGASEEALEEPPLPSPPEGRRALPSMELVDSLSEGHSSQDDSHWHAPTHRETRRAVETP